MSGGMSGGDDSARQIARALAEGPLQDVRAALPGVAGVWAVGGTLRDLLLGRLMIDVDLAVQGDVKAVARA
ncbi:MAG: CCA tRNA nucleotidyltransferase, partial [Thermoleophilia bacterium]|nr:CCA tRNA nucleotidyltransferase [Thermoleophilia bacterium]